MALIKGVKNLKAYQEAYKLFLEVRPLTYAMHQHEQYGGIAEQARRASAGICANLAEGFGKNQSSAELRRYVRIAMGSAYEMLFWLEASRDTGLLPPEKATDFLQRYDHVCRLLRGFEKSISPTQHSTPNTQHSS
ncbi:MAG: four helix bundle protein [Proteobacteria bacterium]|nr:four helix bundle protein [Pseudomonadota bacterium]